MKTSPLRSSLLVLALCLLLGLSSYLPTSSSSIQPSATFSPSSSTGWATPYPTWHPTWKKHLNIIIPRVFPGITKKTKGILVNRVNDLNGVLKKAVQESYENRDNYREGVIANSKEDVNKLLDLLKYAWEYAE